MMDDSDAAESSEYVPRARCRWCGFPMTWAAQRKQYGRLRNRGFDDGAIKALLPGCQKCLTTRLLIAARG